MEDLCRIVRFYEEREKINLFTDSKFSDEEYHLIDKEFEKVNNEFFSLVRQCSAKKDFGFKILGLIINDLSDIHDSIDYKLQTHIIPELENTPLFKQKIGFNNSLLTQAFSKVAVTSGISQIYWFLEKNFANEINIGKPLRTSRFNPPYVDKEGYIMHVYRKFMYDDFLEKELYNHKELWVKKIDEFLKYIPSDIKVCLPIESSKCDEVRFGTFEIFPFKIDDDILDEFESEEIIQNENRNSFLNEIKYAISINCSEEKKEKAFEHLITLFNDLKEIDLVSSATSDEDIKSVFSGEPSDSRIIWKRFKNSLAYFFRQTEHVYGVFGMTDRKWEVICHYFDDKRIGNKFHPIQLESNTSYKNSEMLDSIIKKFFNSIKSL